MMLECATCSNVTVWTRVCMAPMTQFPHLAQSQGTTSHSIVAATARNSVNQFVTDIHSEVHGELKVNVLLPSSGSRRLRLPSTLTQLSHW